MSQTNKPAFTDIQLTEDDQQQSNEDKANNSGKIPMNSNDTLNFGTEE